MLYIQFPAPQKQNQKYWKVLKYKFCYPTGYFEKNIDVFSKLLIIDFNKKMNNLFLGTKGSTQGT